MFDFEKNTVGDMSPIKPKKRPFIPSNRVWFF